MRRMEKRWCALCSLVCFNRPGGRSQDFNDSRMVPAPEKYIEMFEEQSGDRCGIHLRSR